MSGCQSASRAATPLNRRCVSCILMPPPTLFLPAQSHAAQADSWQSAGGKLLARMACRALLRGQPRQRKGVVGRDEPMGGKQTLVLGIRNMFMRCPPPQMYQMYPQMEDTVAHLGWSACG